MAVTSTTATVTPLLIHLLRGATDHASIAATHAKLLKVGTTLVISSCNHIIAAYCICHANAHTDDLFDKMLEQNVMPWTAFMFGYSSAGRPRLVFPSSMTCLTAACHQMPSPSLLHPSACARLADAGLGQKVHARVEVEGYASDSVTATALVDMYGKGGDVEGACVVFDGMAASARNAVSWGSMLSVYAQNALGHEAIQLFIKFRTKSNFMEPNHYMLSSVVNACACVGRLVMHLVVACTIFCPLHI